MVGDRQRGAGLGLNDLPRCKGDAGEERLWSRNLSTQWPLRLDLPTGVYRLLLIGDRNERYDSSLLVGTEPIELEIELAK